MPAAVEATLERVRRLCLSLPDTTEVTAWGHPNFKVGKKMFVAFERYRGQPSIAFRLEPEQQQALRDDARFFVPGAGGNQGWICLLLDRPRWREIERLVKDAYRRTAPAPATQGWTCPRCSARLVQRNLSHSCVRQTVAGFLRDKPAAARRLFRLFAAEVRKLGPVTLHPVKTRIAFMVEVRFAAINSFGERGIGGHLWLAERADSARFHRIEALGRRSFVHHFQMRDPSFLDDEFRRYLRLARAVGERRHLRRAADQPSKVRRPGRPSR